MQDLEKYPSIKPFFIENQEAISLFKEGKRKIFEVVTLALDTATVARYVANAGNFIYVLNATDTNVSVNVQLTQNNNRSMEILPLVKCLGYKCPFEGLYLSWSAQAGKTITLLIGSLGGKMLDVIDNRLSTELLSAVDGLENNTRGLNGNTGTQVNKRSSVTGNSTGVIHTVTAGKNLFLTSCELNFTSTVVTISTSSGYLTVTDGSDVQFFYLSEILNQIGMPIGMYSKVRSFSPPIIIPAGYKVKVIGVETNTKTAAIINGWEE
jgi:hypothetical protein